MPTTCHCGMTLEQPSRRSDCHDCGGTCCRSCVIEIDAETYCRWCATAFIAV